MDYDWSEEQKMLADLAEQVCRRHWTIETLQPFEPAHPERAARELAVHRELAAADVLTLLRDAGSGELPLLDVLPVYAALGRHCYDGPALVAGSAAALLGTHPAVNSVLAGQSVVALLPPVQKDVAGSTLPPAAYAAAADSFLLPVLAGDSVRLYLVPAAAAGLAPSTDMSGARWAAVTLPPLTGAPAATVGRAEFAATVARALLAWSGWCAGASRRCLEEAIAYAKQRHQFGRPIAAFQSIQHQLADLAIAVNELELLLYATAAALVLDLAGCQQVKKKAAATFKHAAHQYLSVLAGYGYMIESLPQVFVRKSQVAGLFLDGLAAPGEPEPALTAFWGVEL